jgi:hypothetical protein
MHNAMGLIPAPKKKKNPKNKIQINKLCIQHLYWTNDGILKKSRSWAPGLAPAVGRSSYLDNGTLTFLSVIFFK